MLDQKPTKSVLFQTVIDALLDNNKPFPPTYLHRFSDISFEDLAEVKKIWLQIQPNRRVAVMEDLEEIAEADTLVCFDDLSRFALSDIEPRVRATAIRLLWENEEPRLATTFIKILENDPEESVRAAAALALGKFVYLGELEEINQEIFHKIEDVLLKRLNGPDAVIVRRRSLEALGFSGRREVQKAIEKAFETDDNQWQISALFAMGRSANNRWANAVLSKINDEDEEVRFEAVRAAGELSIAKARRTLLRLLDNPDDLEEDLLYATIWSLSQIGGPKARDTLETMMDETDDDELADFIESAIDNLDFIEGLDIPGLLALEIPEEKDLYKVVDISEDYGEDFEDDDEDDEEDEE